MSAQHPHTSTTPDLHKLASQKDIQERCDYLKQQNETLLKENEDLKKENEKLRMQLQDSLHGHSDGNIYKCLHPLCPNIDLCKNLTFI